MGRAGNTEHAPLFVVVVRVRWRRFSAPPRPHPAGDATPVRRDAMLLVIYLYFELGERTGCRIAGPPTSQLIGR